MKKVLYLLISLLIACSVLFIAPQTNPVLATGISCNSRGIIVTTDHPNGRYAEGDPINVDVDIGSYNLIHGNTATNDNWNYAIGFLPQNTILGIRIAGPTSTPPILGSVINTSKKVRFALPRNSLGPSSYLTELRSVGGANSGPELCNGPMITVSPGRLDQIACQIHTPSTIQVATSVTIPVEFNPKIPGISYHAEIYRGRVDLEMAKKVFHMDDVNAPFRYWLRENRAIDLPLGPATTTITIPDPTQGALPVRDDGYTAILSAEENHYIVGCDTRYFFVTNAPTSPQEATSNPTTDVGKHARGNPGNPGSFNPISAAGSSCKTVLTNDFNGVDTAIGCVPTDPNRLIKAVMIFALGISGGVALLLMIFGAFQIITSAGNQDALKAGRDRFSSAAIGLLFILFSVLLLQIIGVDILQIPGFNK